MEGQPPLDPHSGIASPGSPIAAASDGVAAVASFDVGHLRRAALEVLAARQALAARLRRRCDPDAIAHMRLFYIGKAVQRDLKCFRG